MAVSFVNTQQPRIDAWIQPGCRADIAVVSTESWPVDTVVTIGVANAAGVIAVPLLTITPDLATLTATVALTGVQVAALAVACPPPYGVIDWQWRTGAGSPLGVGSLHWDLTGARTTQTVTVMMGPAGPGATPEAISALVEDYLVAHPPTGSGDVTGPASAVAGNLAALDATGKILSDSGSKPADFAPASHNHAGVYDPAGTAAWLVGGITPAFIGAQPAGSYAPALGPDDNYLTDTEKAQLHTHPAVIAQGATQADARAAIGAGTSSLVIGTAAGDAKAGDYAPDLSGYVPTSRTVAGKALTGNITLAAGDLTDHAEATQDVVGAMVAAAGGSYDDTDGTITLPGGSGGSAGIGASIRLAGRRVGSPFSVPQVNGWGTDGVLGLSPVAVSRDLPLSALFAWSHTGDGASAVRAGIWSSGTNGYPTALVAAGYAATIPSSNDDMIMTISGGITLTPGWYWFGAVVQGGSGKVFRQYHPSVAAGFINPFGSPAGFNEISSPLGMYQHIEVTGVAGALGSLASATFSAPLEFGPAIYGVVA